MNLVTRIIGLSILVFTEILILIDLIMSIHKDLSPAVGYQIAVFTTVWGSVTAKNFFDTWGQKTVDKKMSCDKCHLDSNIGESK